MFHHIALNCWTLRYSFLFTISTHISQKADLLIQYVRSLNWMTAFLPFPPSYLPTSLRPQDRLHHVYSHNITPPYLTSYCPYSDLIQPVILTNNFSFICRLVGSLVSRLVGRKLSAWLHCCACLLHRQDLKMRRNWFGLQWPSNTRAVMVIS